MVVFVEIKKITPNAEVVIEALNSHPLQDRFNDFRNCLTVYSKVKLHLLYDYDATLMFTQVV